MTYKELLGDKLNWKIINFILAKFIKYEDEGLKCYLKLYVPIPDRYTRIQVFIYSTNYDFNTINKSTDYYDDYLLPALEKHGWLYGVLIEGGDDLPYVCESEMEEITNDLVGKLEFVSQEEDDLEFKEKSL